MSQLPVSPSRRWGHRAPASPLATPMAEIRAPRCLCGRTRSGEHCHCRPAGDYAGLAAVRRSAQVLGTRLTAGVTDVERAGPAH